MGDLLRAFNNCSTKITKVLKGNYNAGCTGVIRGERITSNIIENGEIIVPAGLHDKVLLLNQTSNNK